LSLIKSLLQCDPSKRLSAAQALQHPWFAHQPAASHPETLAVPVGESTHEQSNTGYASSSSESDWGFESAPGAPAIDFQQDFQPSAPASDSAPSTGRTLF